ncbi:PilC/PilY family type IV pilus protein [Ramlibacter sp.]|uniref:PilC/PilY family type IV pilus protein n=1 Tax=Ramlibacter sp. TaxID=1917967 RepID=UPI00261A54C9|nr:PilC/PilY family type IV pilus protein [Ramlibacter sp.]
MLTTAARAAVVALGMLAPLHALPATTDLSTVPLPTYTVGSTVDIKPNILFVLDDSGSMDWDFLPDWVTLTSPSSTDYSINYTQAPAYLFGNAAFNGVAYNPAVTYSPPVIFTSAGAKNTTTYPSMTGTSTTTGGDSSASSSAPNWNAVKYDAYGVQSFNNANVFSPPVNATSSSKNVLTNNAYYYTIIPGEYCTTPGLTTCTPATALIDTYQYPAPLRWCNSTTLANCKALPDASYKYPRIAAPLISTVTFPSTGSSRSVTGITIASQQIMSAATSSSTSASTIAARVAAQINACANVMTGSCAVAGYTADSNGGVLTIFAPGSTAPATPVAATDLAAYTSTITYSAFAASKIPLAQYLSGTAQSSAPIPGFNVRTAITAANDSYPYPGTTAKALTRTDCAGTTCTFKEEMTNYANWWTYYHTRMQMMKSSAALAFSTLDSAANVAAGTTRYRVGYFSLNNNTTTDLVNVTDFDGSGKFTWYSKVLSAKPLNGTALRKALSDAGRLYAGKLNGTRYNGVTVTEPMQYSCQRNYTILSTDGFWNGGAGYKLDATSAVGNQDGLMPRPYKDGAASQIQQSTSQLQSATITQKASKGTLQAQTSQLQKRTSQLQQQTSQLQKQTSQFQIQTYQLQRRTANTAGVFPTTWTNVTSGSCVASATVQCQYAIVTPWTGTKTCSAVAQSTGPTYSVRTATDCQTVVTSAFTGVSACTVDTTTNNSGNTTQCQTVVTSPFTNVASCTPNSTPGTNGNTTQCAYTSWTSWVGAASCTVRAQDTSGASNVATATDCQTVVTSAYANAPSCAVTTTPDSSGNTTQCQYSFAAVAATATCAPAYVSGNFSNATVYQGCTQSAPTWTNVAAGGSCTVTAANTSGQYTACQYAAWTAYADVASCSALAQSTGPTTFNVAKAVQCQAVASGGTSDTLADVAAYYYNTDLRSSTQTGADTTGSCTAADGTTDLCADNVIAYGRDTAAWQHMTVHTLGLGAQGQMVFSQYQNDSGGTRVYAPDYWTQPSGDFNAVANGSTATSTVCTWLTSGTCTWPIPASDTITNIDDLWHTAVNGHGTYFSATDPASLSSGLSAVLAQIVNTPRPGTAAAAASSNPNITSSDNFVFSSSYQSVNWFGELIMQRFNDDGTLTAQQWSAMQLLDCATTPWRAATTYSVGQVYNSGGTCYLVKNAYTSLSGFAGGTGGTDGANVSALTGAPVTRKIFMAKAGALTPFTFANLTTVQQAYFTTPYLTYTSAAQGLSQFCASGASCLSTTAQTNASGSALVDYLSGVRTNEVTYYRSRMHVLGDIVSSEARYVKQPTQAYLDANYASFVSLQSTRVPTVYVGSNDGMLHAFDALTGQERWAFVPTAVMPNLYRLADMNYGSQHQYYVDGTAEVGDICPKAPAATCAAAEWRTIIVGGLNQGGNSYYALDITDPINPTLLWEYSNATMGQSYSNPRITKLANGTWTVMLTSGYNNPDGIGRLYVLNASTGSLLNTISTATGSATSPDGLAKISARSSAGAANNTVDEVYGGDLLGNVWRFDVNGNIGAGGTDAQLMINLQGPSGAVQPITSKPTVAAVNSTPLIIVGTGRYLGLSDLTDTSTFSMYAIKYATSQTATLTTPRTTGSKFVKQTLTATTCPAGTPATICDQGQSVLTGSSNVVDWGVNNGWYLDFVNSGERSVTDPTLALGTLAFTTIKPQSSTTGTITGCTGADSSVNAQSFLYYLDFLSGSAISGTGNVVGELLCTCVATRPSVVKTPSGTVEAIIRMSGGGLTTGTDMGVTSRQDLPYNTSTGTLRRTSWRELNGD